MATQVFKLPNTLRENAKFSFCPGCDHGVAVRLVAEVLEELGLRENTISKELTLLLEADLLDEEGALGIAWDLMGEGAKHPVSFQEGLQSLWEHSAHILNQEYMVTPLAKKYWKEKQEFVKKFIEELSRDLFIK